MKLLHLISGQEWAAAQKAGSYQPPSLTDEGFIHCSTIEQIAATANRYYQGRLDMSLLVIEPDRVDAPVKYENTSGGDELYPHIYGPLNLSAVLTIVPYAPAPDGTFGDPHL
jgi:uncharacterized protein (DUF952 family)